MKHYLLVDCFLVSCISSVFAQADTTPTPQWDRFTILRLLKTGQNIQEDHERPAYINS